MLDCPPHTDSVVADIEKLVVAAVVVEVPRATNCFHQRTFL
jgi:hypothetical protein